MPVAANELYLQIGQIPILKYVDIFLYFLEYDECLISDSNYASESHQQYYFIY